jgi:hypothetical protein
MDGSRSTGQQVDGVDDRVESTPDGDVGQTEANPTSATI